MRAILMIAIENRFQDFSVLKILSGKIQFGLENHLKNHSELLTYVSKQISLSSTKDRVHRKSH